MPTCFDVIIINTFLILSFILACNYYLHTLTNYLSLAFLDIRFSQLADERNHKVCTEANKKELLQSKLNRLRMLKDDIAKDAWMFDS